MRPARRLLRYAGCIASERLSDQRMIYNLPLGLGGLSAAAYGEIEPHLRQPQESALLENRGGLLRAFDDFGGSKPIIFFFAHAIDVAN
jgi:hypothetical protein